MSHPINLHLLGVNAEAATQYTCPFCSTLQAVAAQKLDLNGLVIRIRQCIHCSDLEIIGIFYESGIRTRSEYKHESFYPAGFVRPPVAFEFTNAEAQAAYEEACRLFPVHAPAAGAYARRAIEIILDNVGYTAKVLDQQIKAAAAEVDADRKLPKRLLQKLDYVKEMGNFAMHARRDGELAIVEINEEEVAACLEVVEEMISTLFNEPGKDYVRTVEANKKLKASGKRELPLPPMPEGYTEQGED